MKVDNTLYNAARSFALKKAKKNSSGQIPSIDPAPKIRMKAPSGDKFNVGFATCDITPDDVGKHTYWMAGYGIAKKITGVLDPLTASAMWLDCGDGKGIALVSCDLIGLTGYELKIIRDGLSDFCSRTGCVNITVSCTHTHAGIDTMGYWGPLPKSGKDKDYMKYIIGIIKYLCYEAYSKRRSGKLFFGSIDAPDLLDRWRKPYYTKSVLNRFRFVPDDGSAETWYLNFPAHPNTLGGKNTLLSADYPCYMRREIQRSKNVNIMYSISAIGATDIGKISRSVFEKTLVGGAKLGGRALEIEDERQLMPDITLVSQKFVMPIDNIVLSLANSLGVFNALRCPADSETDCGFISEITYFSIDGKQILTMPGEMFPELVWEGGYCDAEASATGEDASVNSEPLSSIFGDKDIIIFGVTNDMAGYALARNDFVLHESKPYLSRATDRFGRSHYHETNSCGINTGDVIANTCRIIKNTLEEEK